MAGRDIRTREATAGRRLNGMIDALLLGSGCGATGTAIATRWLLADPRAVIRGSVFGAGCGAAAGAAIGIMLPAALWPGAALLGLGLAVLSWIDLEAGVVHDAVAMPLALAGLLHGAFVAGDPMQAAAGLALGYALMRGAEWLFLRLRGYEGLGRGDAWVMAALGAWLGPEGVGPTLALAALLALAAAALAARGMPPADRSLPFVPALALAGYLLWLQGVA